jgi:hypothetical protein
MSKSKKRNDRLMERAATLASKYNNLVWYARASYEKAIANGNLSEKSHRSILATRARILELYPSETEALHSDNDETRNWSHGFNSGVVAATRLLMAYASRDDAGIRLAEDLFPDLMT